MKKLLHPFTESDKGQYMDLTRLKNRDGGYLASLMKTEEEIFNETGEFLKTGRTPEELAEFQDKMAVKAMVALKSVNDRRVP